MAFLNLGFVVILVRLFYIQIINAEEYKPLARKQHESTLTLMPERGNIYDRAGRLLVSNIQSVSVAADPTLIKNTDEICELLENALDIPKERFKEKIKGAKGSFVWLARGVLPSKVKNLIAYNDTAKFYNEITKAGERERGLILISEPKRNFVYASAAAQIIGFTDTDNNGISGIEKGLDSLLKGKSGFMRLYRDGLGRLRPAASLPIAPAVDGKSIVLTLDIELQRIVEHELKRGVEETRSESGTVLAMDPATGEIIAIASYPTYSPGSNGFAHEDTRIRAITDVYEPGSTFKLITAAAALDEGIVSPEDVFDGHAGELKFTGYVIRDVHPIGRVTFRKAMEHSSNIILSNVADKIPDYKFYKYIRDFGFGITLGIDVPGEVTGKIKKPDEFTASTKRYMGFGYGISATPLQICNSYSAVANGGIMMKPYLIKAILGKDRKDKLEFKPEKIRRVIGKNTADTLTSLLLGVVERGTGKAARIPGVKIAGKTGTTQQLVDGSYSRSHYTASFAGYFPADEPKVVMVVVLDKPQGSYYGGAVSAPIFRNIALRWLSISPDLTSDPDLITDFKDSTIVPNILGLELPDASRLLEKYSLIAGNTIEGGIVLGQQPVSGSKVPKGTIIEINTKSYIKTLKDSSKKGEQFKPNVIGLPLRRAIAVLAVWNCRPKVIGSGTVRRQEWATRGKQPVCVLYCE